MQQTPQGSLAERVQAFADDKKKLEDGVANLEIELSRPASLRKDVEGVSANFDRALDLVSTSAAADAEGRLAELSQFVRRRKRGSTRSSAACPPPANCK